MRRTALPTASPYRITGVASREAPDSVGAAQGIANRVVVGWAILRVGVCTLRGLDFEGFLALVIVVTAVHSLARSLA
jgi:hypothetical protein